MLTPYNQGFRDCLQFISKYVYLNKGTKSLQSDIVDLSHWLDDNANVSKTKLEEKLLTLLRKFVKPYVRM